MNYEEELEDIFKTNDVDTDEFFNIWVWQSLKVEYSGIMSNVTDITSKLDDWKVIETFFTEHGSEVIVFGNYRKNAHEIEISSACLNLRLGLIEIAQLQRIIKKYEERWDF